MSPARMSLGFPLSFAVRTDVGLVRDNNEDSFGSQWLADGSLFVVVADGMGGHEAGEVASRIAVDTQIGIVGADLDEDPRARLYRGLVDANVRIIEEGRRIDRRGMGTTSIAAIAHGQEVWVGMVGDSRLYHLRAGHLVWRTLDHTRVQTLLDRGLIDEHEARDHPESSMLTRALGHSKMSNGKPLEPEVLEEPLVLEAGDALVLCSDGLHDLLDDWEIAQTVASRTAEDAARVLVQSALDRGGHDNVTVAVVVAGEQASAYDPEMAAELGDDAPSELPPSDPSVTPRAEPAEGHAPDDAPPPPAPRTVAPRTAVPLSDTPGPSVRWLWAALLLAAVMLGSAAILVGWALWTQT